MGPFKQIKKMFAETRLIATSIVIVSIVMTFVSAIVVYYDLNSFRFPSSFHLLLFICSWKRPDWRLYSSSYSPWPWPGTRYPIYPMHAMRYAAPSLPASRFSRTRPSWSIICTLLYIYIVVMRIINDLPLSFANCINLEMIVLLINKLSLVLISFIHTYTQYKFNLISTVCINCMYISFPFFIYRVLPFYLRFSFVLLFIWFSLSFSLRWPHLIFFSLAGDKLPRKVKKYCD